MADADLAGIREAAGNENTATVLYDLERMVRKSSDADCWLGEDYGAIAKVVADLGRLLDAAPRLVAALEAVLKKADDWDEEAREIPGFKGIGASAYRACAEDLRKVITSALTGTPQPSEDEQHG